MLTQKSGEKVSQVDVRATSTGILVGVADFSLCNVARIFENMAIQVAIGSVDVDHAEEV